MREITLFCLPHFFPLGRDDLMAKNIEKKVECPVCHTRIDKITGFYFNKRYYCKTCFAQVQKEQNNLQELEQYILQKYQIEE